MFLSFQDSSLSVSSANTSRQQPGTNVVCFPELESSQITFVQGITQVKLVFKERIKWIKVAGKLTFEWKKTSRIQRVREVLRYSLKTVACSHRLWYRLLPGSDLLGNLMISETCFCRSSMTGLADKSHTQTTFHDPHLILVEHDVCTFHASHL